MIGNIIILMIIAYAVWVFITMGCMGGVRGYRQYRKDCTAIQFRLTERKTGTDLNPRYQVWLG